MYYLIHYYYLIHHGIFFANNYATLIEQTKSGKFISMEEFELPRFQLYVE